MPKPTLSPLQFARAHLSRPMSPLAVCAIAIGALALGTWIGSSGALKSRPMTVEVDRSAVETIVGETLARNPAPVQDIVKDYLLKNPEVMKQALAEVIKSAGSRGGSATPKAPPPDRSAAVNANAALLFESPRGAVLGNPKGNVTLVEFFDYNCGFCKRALADKLALVNSDPNLRIVLKEHPVLGPASVEAARVGAAVRMQDTDGTRYARFHKAMLGSPQRADKARALSVAAELGLDVVRLEADMTSSEATATIAESATLARALGINGTPSYVVGTQVVVGAVGHAALSERIKAVRK